MRVLLFGMLAEKAGTDSLDLSVGSVSALRELLRERIVGFDRMSYAIAVDRKIVRDDAPLMGNEEIAVLPPFAGG